MEAGIERMGNDPLGYGLPPLGQPASSKTLE